MPLRSAIAITALTLASFPVQYVQAAGQTSAPQNANPSRTADLTSRPFRIAGAVVNARTGELLAEARISLVSVVNRAESISVITGADGHFEFTDLPPGKYSLQGQKRGFLPAAYEQHEAFSTAIVTGPAFVTDHLELRLMPMAALTGHVYDEFGDGVRGARVRLFFQSPDFGLTRVVRAGSSTTDDRGYYDFILLRPGTYFVAVNAKPWFAVHPPSGKSGSPSSIPSSLDVAYPTTYYVAATESDQATAITLEGGDQPEIDVRLTGAPALHMVFPLEQNPLENSSSFPRPLLQKRVFDSIENVPTESASTPEHVELSGLAPGRYDVTVNYSNAAASQQSEGVELRRDGQEFDGSHSQPLSTVTITVKLLGSDPAPNNLMAALVGPRGRAIGFESVDPSGQATFSNVAAGTYALHVSSRSKPLAVARISSGLDETVGHDFTVTPGATLELTASVASGNVAIEGLVQKDGRPLAGVMVALIPRNLQSHLELFRRDQSNFDGTFRVAGVIPGTYTIVAVEDAWGFEWQKPGILDRYIQHGQDLTVGALMRGTVHLPSPVEVQPR